MALPAHGGYRQDPVAWTLAAKADTGVLSAGCCWSAPYDRVDQESTIPDLRAGSARRCSPFYRHSARTILHAAAAVVRDIGGSSRSCIKDASFQLRMFISDASVVHSSSSCTFPSLCTWEITFSRAKKEPSLTCRDCERDLRCCSSFARPRPP